MLTFLTASFFSYVAFADLTSNLELLESHNVEVEFHPVLIGGINTLSGIHPDSHWAWHSYPCSNKDATSDIE